LSVEVRRVRPGEWAELKALRLRALEDTPDAFASTLAEESGLPDRHWRRDAREAANGAEVFVALAVDGATDRLAGLVRGAAWWGEPAIAGVFSMWVDPDLRGRGIGGALLASVTTWAKAGGYRRLRLHVVETNREAVALYGRAGFTATGVREPLREGSDLVLTMMERDLS